MLNTMSPMEKTRLRFDQTFQKPFLFSATLSIEEFSAFDLYMKYPG
jgi:hypothetical protein